MKLLLLSDRSSAYTRALFALAEQHDVRFDTFIHVHHSLSEKFKLFKTVCRRAGILSLPYYLSERKQESAHLLQLLEHHRRASDLSIPADHVLESTGLNSQHTLDLVRAAAPDIIVLGHVGIAQEPLLALAKKAVINAHTGILPDYRGYADPAHMILDKRHTSIGVTVHWVVRQVDAGAILKTRSFKGVKPPSLSALLGELRFLAGSELIHQLAEIQRSSEIPHGTRQELSKGRNCYLLPKADRLRAEALYRSLPPSIFN